jgi:hypothetical protein
MPAKWWKVFLAGLHKSPFHGFSVEFAEHRAYNPGREHAPHRLEALRPHGQALREALRGRDQPALPTGGGCQQQHVLPATSEGAPKQFNKIEFAVRRAAFIALLRKQRDAVGLTVFTDHVLLTEDSPKQCRTPAAFHGSSWTAMLSC